MLWQVRCRVCPQEFVLEDWARVPRHGMPGQAEGEPCPGSERYGYPMRAARRVMGRLRWGW